MEPHIQQSCAIWAIPDDRPANHTRYWSPPRYGNAIRHTAGSSLSTGAPASDRPVFLFVPHARDPMSA